MNVNNNKNKIIKKILYQRLKRDFSADVYIVSIYIHNPFLNVRRTDNAGINLQVNSDAMEIVWWVRGDYPHRQKLHLRDDNYYEKLLKIIEESK